MCSSDWTVKNSQSFLSLKENLLKGISKAIQKRICLMIWQYKLPWSSIVLI